MKLFALFSDHMVLQRDVPAAVWGWADPGEPITVRFADQTVKVQAGDNGRWRATLAPMPASATPRELLVSGRDSSQTLHDVLVGDVWLASGQSNMEWYLGMSAGADAALATAAAPGLRLFTVPRRAAKPAANLDAAWRPSAPETAWSFSAVAYYFGRMIQRTLGVPVGLIDSSWGGTRIEAWTSRPALLTDPAGRKAVEQCDRGPQDPEQHRAWEQFTRDPIAWEKSRVPADPGNDGLGRAWAFPDFDDRAWPTMDVPSKWQSHGHLYSGVFWFRRTIDVPAAWAGKDLILELGACDKHDTTYVNGTAVGATGWETHNAWCTPRMYKIPGSLVRAGRNVIATRVYSYMTDGGLIGPPARMHVGLPESPVSARLPLTGPWRYQVEHNFGPQPGPQMPMGIGNPNCTHALYDNMIAPLAGAALRGALWYQGESNAGAPADYRRLFPLMIRDWRRTFAQPELPFLFVQLANYTSPQQQPVELGWAELREAQLLTLREPHTAMAVTIDIGDANDIHPRNKKDVGERLARAALAQVYGCAGAWSGPLYRAHQIEGSGVRLQFDHAEGLKTSDGAPPRTFAIAGPDGRFAWADATIDGTTVVVRSPEVTAPTAVRYAWANNPPANLCNAAGLPASPFRTDIA